MQRTARTSDRKIFFLLWGLCLIGSLSVLPYVHYLGIFPSSTSTSMRILLTIAQAIPFFGLVCWFSYKILPKTDLHPFGLKNPLKRIVYPALISGILVGLTIFFCDKTLFKNSLLVSAHPPFWAGALASIYGAVNEEVLLRLFLLTLLYFITKKAFKPKADKRFLVLWIINVLVAIIFGLGHLPAAFKLVSPSAFEVVRVLFLNGVAGVVFGWLYWSRGLWTAIAAHFVTDIMIHVLLI